jgi:uncharacterized membrane protein YdjX (TVP38/TMEM64 family)
MAEPVPRSKRALLLKLAVVGVVLVVGAVLVARGLDLKGLVAQGLALIRDAGPWAFFTAMAILPALGAPISIFFLTAGSAFGEKLGMGPVIGLALLAITFNFCLSYFLASRALRPLLQKLVVRLGYQLPQVGAADATDLIILLRVTPGLPFPVQNYLLGLAQVPFRKYLIISCIIVWSFTIAFILFGDALLHGKGKVALIAISLLMALTAGTHMLRKHYSRKKIP